MVNKRERAGLGRGLSALMADIDTASRMTNDQDQASLGPRTLKRVPIDRINPNPDQPRRRFAQTALDELAASIREKGVIQPLIVRPDPNRPDAYQIVAGERRWRAAQQVQLHELPVVIRDLDTGDDFNFTITAGDFIDLDAGQVSLASPIGQGLLGASEGDEVTLRLPAGDRNYKVLELLTLPQQMGAKKE